MENLSVKILAAWQLPTRNLDQFEKLIVLQRGLIIDFMEEVTYERVYPMHHFNSSVSVMLDMFDECLENNLPEKALYIIETLAKNHNIKIEDVQGNAKKV